MMKDSWEFQNPWFLALLAIIPLYIFLKYRYAKKKGNALGLPSIEAFQKKATFLGIFANILPLLRCAFMVLLIIALSRPRIPIASTDVSNEKGVDIILCIDVSLSMLAKDLEPNRLTAVKEIAKEFVDARINDRIGIVEYSREALMKTPLTTDKNILKNTIDQLNTEELMKGTSIDLGLMTSVNHIKDSKAKSKVIILLSDGENTTGSDSNTLLASDIANSKGIKVYTIGIGKPGKILMTYGQQDFFGDYIYFYGESNLDEELLQNVASNTGAKYFRATSNDSMREIYNEINQLEKSEVSAKKYLGFKELYQKYLLWALIILGIELILRTFIYKSA